MTISLCIDYLNTNKHGNKLYSQALAFVDDESKVQLKKFYHRIDSVREFCPVLNQI